MCTYRYTVAVIAALYAYSISALGLYQFIYLIRELHRVDVPRHHPVDPLGLPVGQAGLPVAKPALGTGAAEPAGEVHALPARVAEAAAAGGAAAGRTGVEACSVVECY